ncbi:sensor histidine kinase [Phreatobacter cathodiphilus]|nr:CHASE3 domain-containing protein [Phreatobacter cathodiphilus]
MLAAGITVLILIVAASLWLTARSQQHFGEVVTSRAIRSATADLLSLMQDAETGQRGFLITRDPVFLRPYRSALANFEQRVAAFRESIAAETELASLATRLDERLRRKMEELRNRVALGESGRFEQAVAEVGTGSGMRLMDEIRADLGEVLERGEQSLNRAIAAQDATTDQLQFVSIAGAIIILGLAAAAAWLISGYTRELAYSRAELEVLNTGLEQRVNERTEALTKANEEIQRFAYIVTHDLRAPLVNIMGFTSELEASMKPVATLLGGKETSPHDREEARQAIETDLPEAIGFIRSSTQKMDNLINAILKISRVGTRTLKPEPIDLKALAEASAAAVHHQASDDEGDAGIRIEVPRLEIVSDRLSVDQILGNLLDNAIKYRATDRPIRIAIRGRRDRHFAYLEVEDNGRGIAASDTERVFELFRRSGPQTVAGEGIGLAHVRTLARNLGGDITLTSTLGSGSTFTVRLPIDFNEFKRRAAL